MNRINPGCSRFFFVAVCSTDERELVGVNGGHQKSGALGLSCFARKKKTDRNLELVQVQYIHLIYYSTVLKRESASYNIFAARLDNGATA